MTPEERHLLEQTHKLAEENNRILASIRRSGRIGLIFKTFYWIVLIAISLGAYYAVQPYVDDLSGLYTQAKHNLETIKNVTNKINGGN